MKNEFTFEKKNILKMKNNILIALAFCAFTGCMKNEKQKGLENLRWIDLTHSFDSSTLYWPNNKTGFEHHQEAAGITPNGYYYSSFSYCTPEHGGTHLDAPIHFAEKKLTVDQIPRDQLTGNAIVIDVSSNALKNRDYII